MFLRLVWTDLLPGISSLSCTIMSPIVASHMFVLFYTNICQCIYQVRHTPTHLCCHSSIANALQLYVPHVILITWHATNSLLMTVCDVMFCSWICLKYVEFGLQSQEPPHRPQGTVLPVTLQSILTPISAATTAYKTVTSTTVTTTTTVAKTPTTAPAIATRVSGVRTRFILFCFSPVVLSF